MLFPARSASLCQRAMSTEGELSSARSALERHQNVLAEGALKNVRSGMRVSNSVRQDGLMDVIEILTRNPDSAPARYHLAHQYRGKRLSCYFTFDFDRNARLVRYGQRNVLQHDLSVAIDHRDVVKFDVSVEVGGLSWFACQQAVVHKCGRGKFFDHHLPPQRHVLCPDCSRPATLSMAKTDLCKQQEPQPMRQR